MKYVVIRIYLCSKRDLNNLIIGCF
jgi:hypothetical protein